MAGLPFGFFFEAAPAYMRQAQLPLTVIGLAHLAQLPWIAKPLWAPFVDARATPARWLLLAAGGMAAALLALALLPSPGPSLPGLLVCLSCFCAAAATQDLVVDAYFVRYGNRRPAAELVRISALRMAGYKLALHGGSALCIVTAGWAGWRPVLLGLASVQGLGSLSLARKLSGERAPAKRAPSPSLAGTLMDLRAWLGAADMPGAVGFVFAYKLTLSLLGPMGKPFWLDLGVSSLQLGATAGGLGLLGAIGGIALASVAGSRLSWGQALGCGSVLEAGTVALYLWAHHAQVHALVGPALLVEGLAQGVTTTLLISVLARLCTPEHAATQFAFLSAVFALARIVGGGCSGVLAQHLGWQGYFWLLPCLSVPALTLLPALLRRLAATPPAPAP